MLDEARRIVGAARHCGLTLRLIGGLAVRKQCRSADLAVQRRRDVDLDAPMRQAGDPAARTPHAGDPGVRRHHNADPSAHQ
jgi:hypothetical protein